MGSSPCRNQIKKRHPSGVLLSREGDNRTRLHDGVAAVETGGKQQSAGLARDLSRKIFPIRFVGAIIDRPHCTTGFAGGE